MFQQIVKHIDSSFIRKLFAISIPVAIQNIMFSSRSLVDVLMLGQLGEFEVAAVGVSSRTIFVAITILIGLVGGGGVFISQYWGAGNIDKVRESTAQTWVVATTAAILNMLILFFAARFIIGLTTTSEEVIGFGEMYLKICAFTMLPIAFAASVSTALRSIHQATISTVFTGVGLLANVFLNWVLIFGKFGFPELGITGAAIATLVSSVIEAGLLYFYIYGRKHILAFSLSNISQGIKLESIKRFLAVALPITMGALLWSLGLFFYNVIIGKTGVQGLTAFAVIAPIESFIISFLIGNSVAASVLVGNQLGAKNYDKAYYQAIAITAINFIVALSLSIILFIFKDSILSIFSALTEETYLLASQFLLVLILAISLKGIPIIIISGILRAGGDVKYTLMLDIVGLWVFTLPISYCVVTYTDVSAVWVYFSFLLDDVIKLIGASYRLFSRKWINTVY